MRVQAILISVVLALIPDIARGRASADGAGAAKEGAPAASTRPDDSTDKIAFLKSVIRWQARAIDDLKGQLAGLTAESSDLKGRAAALPRSSQGVPGAKMLTKGMTEDQVLKLLEDKPDGDITDADNNEVMTWDWCSARADIANYVYVDDQGWPFGGIAVPVFHQAWPYGHIVVCVFHHGILEYFTDDKPG